MSFIPHMPCDRCAALEGLLEVANVGNASHVATIKDLQSRLDAAEKEATEAENDARQWAKQLDQQVRVNRDDKAKLLAAEGRLEDAESRLNGIKALRVEMVDLIGADLDATLQGLLWPKDVEKHTPERRGLTEEEVFGIGAHVDTYTSCGCSYPNGMPHNRVYDLPCPKHYVRSPE